MSTAANNSKLNNPMAFGKEKEKRKPTHEKSKLVLKDVENQSNTFFVGPKKLSSSTSGVVLKNFVIPKGHRFLPEKRSHNILNVPLTKVHFLDAYSKAKWNLSNVPRPSCFKGIEIMPAPDHYNESSRIKSVKKFLHSEHWKDREAFNKLIAKATKAFDVKGAAISILDSKKQIIKYQTQLNIAECPKHISIDAHALLSADHFVLMDATKDWRTCKNPLIKGPPNIRFYLGVPLTASCGSLIGVFSVFDSNTRAGELDRVQIVKLKSLADQVMSILNSSEATKLPNTTITVPLLQLIGRPTSQNKQLSATAVYEKDGSGSSYSQNFNFRYNVPTVTSTSLIQQSTVKNGPALDYASLSKVNDCRDIKSASSALSKIIVGQLKFDFVCIVEIKVSQKYKIENEFFPHENSIDADSFKFANKLVRMDKEQIMTRFLGSYGYRDNSSDFDQFKSSDFFYGSFSSEFGVFFESAGKAHNIKFKSGISMPFYRFVSKVVRRKKIHKSDSGKSNEGKSVEVFLRSGGYLVAAFNDSCRAISEDEMNFIYYSACILRRMFISN